MEKDINYRSLEWLGREQKRARNALWNAIERKAPQQDINNLTNKLEVLDYLIGLTIKENAPTINAEPVRHGRWEYKASRASNGKLKWHCSVCGIIPLFDGVAVLKYCHHCGAKMDGDTEG